ncbi:unnamed protein product, partial [Rotaria sp. Silwood1]
MIKRRGAFACKTKLEEKNGININRVNTNNNRRNQQITVRLTISTLIIVVGVIGFDNF